jgi:hemolysin III
MGILLSKDYTFSEELANSITHGVGWALAIVAMVLLVVFSSLHGDAWHIVSCSIFGAGLVLMYTNSTMYHSLTNKTAKKVFKILDHSSIFFLIAATYTAYTLTVIRGPWGWTLFGIVWGGFAFGTIMKIFFAGRFKLLSISIYILLGWCVIIAIKPIIENLTFPGFLLLGAGGIAYSIGAIIYAKKKVKYSHAVWHVYVIIGSLFHFLSVFLYVIPR